jgi:hypothetical protein
MWIRLVVLEFDVVTRLVLFDERGFQDQRFYLIVGYDELKICNLINQGISFAVEWTRGAKIERTRLRRFFALPT